MKKINFISLFILFIFITGSVLAQPSADTTKTISKKKEKIKKGWTFGAVPAIAYDSDLGFRYGGLVNLYYYGDGSSYPRYNHSIYLEWSHTTKGSDKKTFSLDSYTLIPGVRFTADVSYITEQGLDFYGFNGYQSTFNNDLITQKDGVNVLTYNADSLSPNYLTKKNFDKAPYRLFYKHDRKMLRAIADFKGKFLTDHLQWLAGAGLYWLRITPIGYTKLNEGKKDSEILLNKQYPDPNNKDSVLPGSLYERYVDWGVISQNEKDGGWTPFAKLGLIYDTRDNEPNPMKGLWSSIIFIYGHSFMDKDANFAQVILTHRQYFTLYREVLNFAYRINYQQKIAGNIPFYMLPYLHATQGAPIDGMGGSQTIRGVLRNRVVGDGMAFANFEFRWKFLRTKFLKQNFYIALSAFCDMGMVVDKYNFDKSLIPAGYNTFDTEKPHIGFGGGLHFALNQNFIVAVDYGLAADKRDGNSGLYIGLNFLY